MTIEIETRVPNPIMMAELGIMKAMDMKHFADVGFDGYATKPVGTGPYKPVAWQRDRIQLESHRDGWRPGKVDKLTWLSLPEPAARTQAFQSNQIDIAMQVQFDNRQQVERAGGRLHSATVPSILTLMFQSNPEVKLDDRIREHVKPAYDKRVRQALNHAVNRDEYLKTIIGDGVTVATGQPAPRSVRGYQPDIKPYAYDPAKARALLAEAGHGGGIKMFAEVVNNVSELNDTYLKVGEDLKKVGVDLEIKPITLADLIARSRAQKQIEGALFSFDMGAFPTMDMMRSINALHSCNTQGKWTCFAEIEPVIKDANAEFDLAKRDQLLRRIALFYHEQATSIFLHEQYQLDAISNKVQRWNPVNWYINWHEIEFRG
jgi:peptide/nickel transport system substrate-binding protein